MMEREGEGVCEREGDGRCGTYTSLCFLYIWYVAVHNYVFMLLCVFAVHNMYSCNYCVCLLYIICIHVVCVFAVIAHASPSLEALHVASHLVSPCLFNS